MTSPVVKIVDHVYFKTIAYYTVDISSRSTYVILRQVTSLEAFILFRRHSSQLSQHL